MSHEYDRTFPYENEAVPPDIPVWQPDHSIQTDHYPNRITSLPDDVQTSASSQDSYYGHPLPIYPKLYWKAYPTDNNYVMQTGGKVYNCGYTYNVRP